MNIAQVAEAFGVRRTSMRESLARPGCWRRAGR
jgi:hypothetical protein